VAELTLSRTLALQLLEQAQRQESLEVCGLIGSQDELSPSIYPISNIADDPATRFLLDPAEQVAAMRQMRNKGETLFAIYHSHPTSDTHPSARDIAETEYRDPLYLIIALGTKGLLELGGYRLTPDGPQTVDLILD